MSYRILTINPGSTSTKIAVFNDENEMVSVTINHSNEELRNFQNIFDQYAFRMQHILESLNEHHIKLDDIQAVVGRGGFLRPLESGVYEVNEQMISDLRQCLNGEHASNLGAILAHELAGKIPGCIAIIADPVVVDELNEVARISGLPQFPRRSAFHALNHKAIGRRYASENGKEYSQLNLVIAHLGGGISVAAHQQGRVIDTNQALDGFGPFSPQRAGTMDAGALIRMCYAGIYQLDEIQKLLVGNGGLVAHLGTNDIKKADMLAQKGDYHARLILEAMAYGIGKEIGSMLAVLEGKVDAILLTGGIAYNDLIVNYIKKMVSKMAPVYVYPGENEMQAMAEAAVRVLSGKEKIKNY